MEEFALIVFTICMQTAIGTIIFLMVAKQIQKDQEFKLTALVGSALSIVGVLVSFFHLGTPTHAFYTIMNLGSSWLSREIFFSGGFMALATIFAFIVYKKPEFKGISNALGWVTSIVGLVDVFMMAKVYSTTSVPSWQGVTTFIEFYATVVILGSAVLFFTGIKNLDTKTTLYFSISVAVAVAILGAFTIPHYLELGLLGGAAAVSAETLSKMNPLVIAQWIVLILSSGVLLSPMIKIGKYSFTRYYVIATALSVGLIAGRYLFYAIHVATRVGLT